MPRILRRVKGRGPLIISSNSAIKPLASKLAFLAPQMFKSLFFTDSGVAVSFVLLA